jgi:hexosaminidase
MARTLFFSALAVLCASASLWPAPKTVSFGDGLLSLDPSTFTFTSSTPTPILTASFSRYMAIVTIRIPPLTPTDALVVGVISALSITLRSTSETLGFNTSEAYELTVSSTGSTLVADTVFGALRGLETFSQLVEFSATTGNAVVREATILDAPRFQHRGALVDTSRHFIGVPTLLAFLDAMAYNKLNVFHWHIVDSNSFPYVSTTFPALSGMGAYGNLSSHTYSPTDVAAVIQYARERGIRTIPEFDTPGHSTSWGIGEPGLTTACFDANGTADGTGPIDPTRKATYDFMQALFAEIAAVFDDDYVHIGGDEVDFTCWQSNPNITVWMAANGMAGNYSALESYYVQRIINLVTTLPKHAIGWQELFDNGLALPSSTIVNVWKFHNSPAVPKPGGPTWQEEMAKVTAAGFYTVLSSPWYLNVIEYGVDWTDFYASEPLNFTGSAAQKALVLGGELSMWGEWVDATNLLSRTFPRGSAVAERLWSPADQRDVDDATARISDMRCRLIARGLAAEPLDPGFCPGEFIERYVPPWAGR